MSNEKMAPRARKMAQAQKRKKSLKQVQDEMFDKNFEARFDKAVRKTKEDLSKVDKGFMKDFKNRDKIIFDTFTKADRVPVKEMTAASNREGASVYNKMAKGGRANYGSGGKACAQIKGFGKARRPNKR